MAVMSFGITTEQEKIVLQRMKLSGETNKSEHFRRVYFEADTTNDALVGELKRQIDVLTEAVERSQNAIRQLASAKSDGLELKLLAGLYMLLYPSVTPGIQSIVDQHLDVKAIEGFLTENKKRRFGS
jgi:hypothetical protein